MKSEATSTSSDGLSRIPEILQYNTVYSGAEGEVYGYLYSDGRFFIHVKLFNPNDIKHLRYIQNVMEEELVSRGIKKYYTVAHDAESFRYNTLFGFKTNLEVWGDVWEIMVKDL